MNSHDLITKQAESFSVLPTHNEQLTAGEMFLWLKLKSEQHMQVIPFYLTGL